MPHRFFTDSQGLRWTVVAVRPPIRLRHVRLVESPESAAGWLSFLHDGDRRRLAPIPDGWETLDDAGLLHLLSEASVLSTDASSERRSADTPPPRAA